MSAPLDYDAIRARHAIAQERLDANGPGPRMTLTLAAAHADRAALLAAINAMADVLATLERQRDSARTSLRLGMDALCAAGLTRPIEPDPDANIEGGISWLRHQRDDAQAALDRLAAVTVDEIAQAIAETRGQSLSGVETIWHGLPWATEVSAGNQTTYRAMAAAVVALLRSRMTGQP